MNKKPKRLTHKEFSFTRYEKDGEIFYKVDFYTPSLSLAFTLTNNEWTNLLEFLRSTKSKKHLPENAVAYAEFDIDTNFYRYLDTDTDSVFETIFREAGLDYKPSEKYKRKIMKMIEDAKKHILARRIYLRKGFALVMPRERFKRFREYVLSNEK